MNSDVDSNLNSTIKKPSLFLVALESRALLEIGAHYAMPLFYRDLPKGDGRPVLVIPGFGANDFATKPLRRFLNKQNYDAVGWRQGINMGSNPTVRNTLTRQLEELHRTSGAKVSILGWSLGGVYARELGRQFPELVHSVLTLGSPFAGDLTANSLSSVLRLFNRRLKSAEIAKSFKEKIKPPSVPTTSIYSKSDGVVAWQCSLEQDADHTQNIEVFSSHIGLVYNPIVLKEIAQVLAN